MGALLTTSVMCDKRGKKAKQHVASHLKMSLICQAVVTQLT